MANRVQNDITVVLSAFKRVDVLAKQLQAVQEQTVKAKEIWLFQDRIPRDYEIVINDSLLKRFDNVRTAPENVGVWGRFDFAREAGTPYVCIFDDDTIPQRRWLENCLEQMEKQEGVYGTIGVVLTSKDQYIQGGHFRIGWARPNEQTQEVDFVGHSWFLKTEWLEYMFTEAGKYSKKYKYAAEDMALSFACLNHGIHTFVPPHPVDNKELWGSDPVLGEKIGTDEAALSLAGNTYMDQAAREMIHDGWKILLESNPDYVREKWKKERKVLRKLRIKKYSSKFSGHLKKEIVQAYRRTMNSGRKKAE